MVDDFSLHNLFAKKSLFESVSYMYMNWSGRSFTLFLCDLALLDFKITPFFVAGVALLYVLSLRNLSDLLVINSKEAPFFRVYFFLVLTICLIPFIPHVVFWSTSGLTYIVPLYIATIWIKTYYYNLEKLTIGKLVFSLFAGSLLEQASILMLFIGSLSFISVSPFNEVGSKRNKFIFLGFFLVGLAVLLFAPGNFVRSEVLNKMNPENTEFLDRAIEVFRRLAFASWKKIIISIIGGIGLAILIDKVNISSKWKLKSFSIVWVGSSLLLVFPFLVVDTPLNQRTLFYSLVCLSIFGLGVGLKVGVRLKGNFQVITRSVRAKNLILLFPLFMFTLFLIREIKSSYLLASGIDEREKLILNSKAKDIVINPIKIRSSKLYFYKEISRDPKHWVNASMAEYYGIKTIRIK
ncbi:MAG: hypothetical protein CME70_21415 [Halobacteriovorax sp.]|nr:hypothetical protein [Halobacteriovorax sp.]|tara:strand:- start:142044 stop:143267 length:1224 start_codon:yes stop_codon:yes gene_type:complete